MPNVSSSPSALGATLQAYKKYAFPVALAVLVIFHGVGLWGLLLSGNPTYFQQLTPMNLLLTNGLLFSFHKRWTKAFALFAAVVFSAGFVAEVIGVHTGLIFGNYQYGEALGTKLWDVPLLIGLNWLMLVYTTGAVSSYFRLPWLANAAISALLMVLLDYFIEPVAMAYDFWDWQNSRVPVSNFVGWFGVALLLQVYNHWGGFYRRNRLAPYVYLVQLLFFICLFLAL
ncbi:carotenoid biosynthesis protein [Pontibacter sp. CAU 1760]